jgi:mono/diheme cytochrome c family protein
MRRLFLAGEVLGLAILIFAAIGAAILVRGGISARPEPSALEARFVRALRHLAIPSADRGARNPIPASPRVLAAGLAHFADHCATCHANDGSGQTSIGRGLNPRAPDMRRQATQNLSDGELFYIVENGVRVTGMPAWGGPGSAEGSWHLVHFIRHLPALTAVEKAEMEWLNPKSPDEWRAQQDEDAFLRGAAPSTTPALGHGSHSH